MRFIITDQPSERDKAEIYQGLLNYNLSRIENKDLRPLGVFLEDDSGNKIAGLVGETHGNWLEINYLWVDEKFRGQDIGTNLVHKAEETAKVRACKYAFLNTFGFQAREFYIKLGYNEVFVLEEYPLTGKKHYFTKNLE